MIIVPPVSRRLVDVDTTKKKVYFMDDMRYLRGAVKIDRSNIYQHLTKVCRFSNSLAFVKIIHFLQSSVVKNAQNHPVNLASSLGTPVILRSH